MNKNKVLHAFEWKFFERISVQITNFIVTLILARILDPSEYGEVAIILVFISISNTFVQGGFNTALIQKKDVNGDDYTSVFAFTIGTSILVYFFLFFIAPYLSKFYDMSDFVPVMRTMALVLLPGAINSIQVAFCTRDLQFKIIWASSAISSVISGVTGIFLALNGFGVWALVIQQIINQVCNCLVMGIIVRDIPHGKISKKSLNNLIPFGSKILASNLLVSIFLNLRSLIIGIYYTSEELAYFNKGKQFPQTMMDGINTTIQTVLLPMYSKEQDNQSKVKNMMRQTIRLSCYIITPMLLGLALIARPLIRLLLTDKWIASVPFIQMFCVSYMLQPAQIANAQAYKALGDSSTPLKLEGVRKTIEIGLLFLSIKHGTLAIAFSAVLAGIISLLVSLLPNKKILNYKYKEQFSDFGISIILSLAMVAIAYFIGTFINNYLQKMIVEIICAVIVYIIESKIFNIKEFTIVINLLKSKHK